MLAEECLVLHLTDFSSART
jgi:hypothetical protein